MAGRPLAPAAGLPARPPALARPPASSGAAPSFPRPSLSLGLLLPMLNPPRGHLPPGAPRPDDNAPSSRYCLSLGPGASSEPPSRPAAMGPTAHLLLICQACGQSKRGVIFLWGKRGTKMVPGMLDRRWKSVERSVCLLFISGRQFYPRRPRRGWATGEPSSGKGVPGTRRGRLRAAKSAPRCEQPLTPGLPGVTRPPASQAAPLSCPDGPGLLPALTAPTCCVCLSISFRGPARRLPGAPSLRWTAWLGWELLGCSLQGPPACPRCAPGWAGASGAGCRSVPSAAASVSHCLLPAFLETQGEFGHQAV